MNETIKTSIFLVLAVLLVALAFLTRPVVHEIKMEEMVGKPLFPKFENPLDVKKLEIVRLDAAGEPGDFRIAEVNGVWSIPSHDNYPADARDQMGKVTESLVGLKVLDVVATLKTAADATSLHVMYGVIDPTSESASLGEGIGIKVKLTGPNDDPLVDLIIGKEVDPKEKKSMDDPEEPGKMRYVRVAGQVPVYVVEIDPKRFTTHFDQWIERNLLDISTMNINEVFVDEYSLKVEMQAVRSQGALIPREVIIPTFTGDMTFHYNASATGAEKWKLEKMMGFRNPPKYEYFERPMKPDLELNVETLDGMISALNDLKIVSVTKKPSVFAKALKEGATLENIEPDPSLKRCGFYLVPMPDLKGGTKKTIKQLLSNEGDIQLKLKDGTRYHLRFGDLTGTESEIDAQDEKAENGKKDAAAKKEEKSNVPTMGANRYLFITASFDESVVPQPEVKPVPEIPAEGKPEDLENLKKEKESVEKSNQREQDRYKDALEAGKKRAQKLTERFADWYYVIPEDVYKKIHLTQANVFRPKQEEKDHDHADHDRVEPKPSMPSLPGLDETVAPKADEKKEEPKPADAPKAEEKKEEPKPADAPKSDEKKEEPKPAEAPKSDEKKEEPKPADTPRSDEKKEEPKDGPKPFDPFGGKNPSE